MKKTLLFLILSALFSNCFAQNTITYPIAIKKPVTDTFFKKYMVTDNYRWMENLDDPTLKKWVDDENSIAEKFISKASLRNNTMSRIDELSHYKAHVLQKKGDRYYFYAYPAMVGTPALYSQRNVNDDEPVLVVDPNFISHKDKIILKGFEVSRDSRYLAYEFGRNGSDWTEINVMSTAGTQMDDHLDHIKFSGISWEGDGFFYSAYPQVANMDRIQGQVVYYHKLGTKQSDDEVIFKRNNPEIRFSFSTTKDERYFILEEENKKAGLYSYFYIDYKDPNHTIKPLLTNLKYGIDIISNHNDKFIATTVHNANNGSIVEIDPANPLNWKTIAPSFSEALLLDVVPVQNKIIAVYQSKLHPGIVAMDYEGKILHSQAFPLGTSVRVAEGSSADDTELLYYYQSYTTPPIAYSFNTETYERKLTATSSVSFDYDKFVYKQTEYITADSAKIPMLLIYKKDIKLDGNNPTLLETYGGFGAINSPHFDTGLVYFLQKGGVYAYAYVRGEGELGLEGVNAARGAKKQTTFSDFISGAEYLIKEKYTTPAKLAISGGSNGGLVVAVAAIQRPDLFKAVVPIVAPFDMLRFENFTIGSLHNSEYGTVKDSTSFTRLYNYSPYNNIKPAVNYPGMLIITSDNDDRVPPLHSYKFTAKMQNREAQTNPVLLLVNKQSGHYGISENNVYDMLMAKVNLYSFIVEMLK